MAYGKTLELREIRPKRYIAARRKRGIRITPDGVVYQGRGWRRLGRVDKQGAELDALVRRAA